MQQVFAEKPHVHRAFVENVPQAMSETEFWTRFAKHEIRVQVNPHSLAAIGIPHSADDIRHESALQWRKDKPRSLYQAEPPVEQQKMPHRKHVKPGCQKYKSVTCIANLSQNVNAAQDVTARAWLKL